MAISKALQQQFDNIHKNLAELNEMKAQCRSNDQKKDHDSLITAESNIQTNSRDIKNHKAESLVKHKEFEETDKEMSKSVEQLAGNLNQSMIYIKELQKNGRIKVGFQTAIVAGIISTVVAGIIIYFATTVFENIKNKSIQTPQNKILLEISKHLEENTKTMKSLKEKVDKPVVIKVEEK